MPDHPRRDARRWGAMVRVAIQGNAGGREPSARPYLQKSARPSAATALHSGGRCRLHRFLLLVGAGRADLSRTVAPRASGGRWAVV
jgi:hypothetical protein